MRRIRSAALVRACVLVLLLVLLPAAAVSAAEGSGEIVYMEGDVSVFRDGEKLPAYQVDIGFMIEEYDMIETGSRGYIEVALTYGSGATLRVNPDTSFYFEVEDTVKEPKSEVHMMAGSMAYRVSKLSRNSSFNVRTESVVMGVRGTSFDATVSPEGGILITCEEGLVSCTNDAGAEEFSRPGQVVENAPNKGMNKANVPVESLSAFKESWKSAREQVFKNGAETFIRAYARRYLDHLPRFQQAYRELSSYEQALRAASTETADLGSLFRLKARVTPAIVRMRSVMPLFDDVFFRLQTLEGYHRQGIGRGMINDNLSSQSFFNRFSGEKQGIKQALSKTYFLFKLYSILNEKAGGGPSITDDPFGNDPFGSGFSPSGPPMGGRPDTMFDDF